jgi:hypothetical protein
MHRTSLLVALLIPATAAASFAGEGGKPAATTIPSIAEQPAGTWYKRSPRAGAPTSPRKSYESSWDWDPFTRRIIRHGGHDGEPRGAECAEVWVLDPATMKWELKQPNTSPPGSSQTGASVFAACARRFVRFPAYSNSHGWQWTRMIGMRNWSSWAYDNATGTWRNMKPLPHVDTGPGRCASYDRHNGAILVFDKETRIYDLYTNTWTLPRPPESPAGRSYGSMVYDSGRRRHVMFGRHHGNDPVTWAYDLRRGKWLPLRTEVHPPGNRTSPVMSYDSRNQAILCVLRSDERNDALQTWLFDCPGNSWKRLRTGGEPLGGSGNRSRLMVYVPELDVHVLESRTRSEQQIWTFRWSRPKTQEAQPLPPGAPLGLKVEVDAGGTARLSWRPGPGPKPEGYRVFRGSAAVPWKAEFKPVGPGLLKAASFVDRGLAKGKVHHYRVQAIGENGREGGESAPARTQPRALDRVVVSVPGRKRVELSWPKHAARDVVGYNVYRADVEVLTTSQVSYMHRVELKPRKNSPVGLVKSIGSFRKLNPAPLRETSFTDKTVDLSGKDRKVEGQPLYELTYYDRPYEQSRHYRKEGTPYRFGVRAYRVTAVNALGVESGPSPWSLTIPSAVEGVFSKEDGATVHLKWKPNPEKAIKGYLVYRMNDRFRGRFELLTPEAVREPKFSDTANDKRLRRYFVIAVDALGQEGIPSSPVWGYRERHEDYAPFGSGLGTWHQ